MTGNWWPIAIATATLVLAVVAIVWRVATWFGAVNTDRNHFKAFMDEVRKDVRELRRDIRDIRESIQELLRQSTAAENPPPDAGGPIAALERGAP